MQKIFKYDVLEPRESGMTFVHSWYSHSKEVRTYKKQLFNNLCKYLDDNMASSWECVMGDDNTPNASVWTIHEFERKDELIDTLFSFTAKTVWNNRIISLDITDSVGYSQDKKHATMYIYIQSHVEESLLTWRYVSIEQDLLRSGEYWPLGEVTNHLYQFILQYYNNLSVEDKLKLLPDNVVELVHMVNKVNEII